MISLEVSKAFDCLWYKGLLAKLPIFGLHHTLIKRISSFLSDRSIAISVYGYLSNPHSIKSVVPQGSVILPVLFILFIDDLLTSTSSSILSFADDTYLSSSLSYTRKYFAYSSIPLHSNTSASLLTNDLTNVLNEEKAKQVVISSKHHQDSPCFHERP